MRRRQGKTQAGEDHMRHEDILIEGNHGDTERSCDKQQNKQGNTHDKKDLVLAFGFDAPFGCHLVIAGELLHHRLG